MPKHAPAVTPQQALALARLWDPAVPAVTPLRTGENSVWAFEAEGGRILRVTSEIHRTSDQLKAELAFVAHVGAGGLNAAQPIEALTGENVVDVSPLIGGESATYAIVFKQLEGRHFEYYSPDIGPPLFNAWGRTMARIHLLSETFVAPPGLRRPDWNQDEVAGCPVIGTNAGDRSLQLRDDLIAWLSGMTAAPKRYGMVHGDLERTNFVLHDGELGIFDFDDCCHHWFCWDIVCAMWVFRHAAKDDRAAFLGWFLDGYSTVREPDMALLQRLTDLIRLRTLGLMLYRARARGAPPTDEWTQRMRLSLDPAWSW